MAAKDNYGRIPATAGTIGWYNADGEQLIIIITPDRAAQLEREGVKYLLTKGRRIVGYEHYDGHVSKG